MLMAIRLAEKNVADGGGPFGAVVARGGEVVATGVNRVVPSCDPTAHAEVNAIRAAASALGRFDLSDCELYTSCEPCPMCLGAIYWAHIGRIYYACDRNDAAAAGFDDRFIYDELSRGVDSRRVVTTRLLGEQGRRVFDMWNTRDDKVPY